MAQAFRLAKGGRVDRTRPIRFEFNGRLIEGFAGDTVASALLANGVRFVGRSFKYHRPRGVLSHGSDEPNALLSINRGIGSTDPNNRATVVEITEGLVTSSQNHWPSLEYDIGAISDHLSPLFAAGFYYKTFMWPRPFWRALFEPAIRAAAGLGVAPECPDANSYIHRHAHCDVLIIGAGPAGLAAALASSAAGKDVILVDEQADLGGSLLHDVTSSIDRLPAQDWLEQAATTLRARSNVTLLRRTTAFGYYNHNHIGLLERVSDHLRSLNGTLPRERLWQVRAARVVLTTGAHERPLIFPDNDRPGIMLSESLRVYINRFGVAPGRRLVIATNGASAYRVAADAKTAGLDVTLLDLRVRNDCGHEVNWIEQHDVKVLTSHEVVGSIGRRAVQGLVVRPIGDPNGQVTLPCDCVGISGGWTPSVHLFSQSRGALNFAEEIDAFVPGVSRQAETSAGAAKGTYELADCLREGWEAGFRAAGRAETRSYEVSADPAVAFKPVPTAKPKPRSKAFLDFQNDVTEKDVRLALSEGFESIEHVKRYTTVGMATDQGKSSNMSALKIVSEVLQKPIPQVGTTTFRPPYTPVTFGAIAGLARGALFDPTRKTPLDSWAEEHGARFENVGQWRRAWYFPRSGEAMHAAVNRECRTVRSSVGLFDGSTIGKIEVVGPDAATFLNRLYINDMAKLVPGRCRYGLMLKDDGYVFDDGIVARLADDRFHVTTTTGGAARVMMHMEDYLQTEWPHLKVFLTSTTEQWAMITVQGPKAREAIAPFVSGIDLSNEAFPHTSVRIGIVCDVPVRLFRVSFTGELGYEINVPANHAPMVWEAIVSHGAKFDIALYGTEAMHILRAERGFIIAGQETDGTVTPDDLGFNRMISQSKGDFIGKRSLSRPDLLEPGRKQLVGLLTDEPKLVLEEGAHVVRDPNQKIPMKMLGHVTSSYWSEACGRSIALALVAVGRSLIGATLHATTQTGFAATRVTEPYFIDPSMVRVNG